VSTLLSTSTHVACAPFEGSWPVWKSIEWVLAGAPTATWQNAPSGVGSGPLGFRRTTPAVAECHFFRFLNLGNAHASTHPSVRVEPGANLIRHGLSKPRWKPWQRRADAPGEMRDADKTGLGDYPSKMTPPISTLMPRQESNLSERICNPSRITPPHGRRSLGTTIFQKFKPTLSERDGWILRPPLVSRQ
jgi:hypothetical protein